MKIAVLSDIHGNLPAMNAVCNHMSESVDRIICLGDIIGYGPKPRECVDRIKQNSDLTIRGNHEKALIRGETFNSTTAHHGLEHAKKKLYQNHYDWIQQLPDKIANDDTLIFHSHPETEQHVYPEDVENVIDNLNKQYNFVIYGHTHVPVNKHYNQTLIINPGSVGQPRDSDQRASYAVVDYETKQAEINRVEYNIQETIDQLRENGFPEESEQRIRNAN